jgi:hypothetical protein
MHMSVEDENDLDGFFKGLAFTSQLSNEQIRELLADGARLDLRHYCGQGSALCTKLGFQSLESLVFRRVRSLADARTYDPEEVLREVADKICPALSEGAQRGEHESTVFDQIFASALRTVAKERKKSTYHFPVVLAEAKSPDEFEIGPVKFRNASRFATWLAGLKPDETDIDERIERHEFTRHMERFGWMASARVPACSSEIAKVRAELAARTAVNIVRVWFGLGHGSRMRLVHAEPAVSNSSDYLIEVDRAISLCSSRTWEGAVVVDGWFSQVHVVHLRVASWLIRDIVFDERTEIVERLIDALSWFGDAAFEPSPGAKIAKLVMLLERITSTANNKRFSKPRFCRRVAILAGENDEDFTTKYWDAYRLYNARSAITHGASSQASDDHWAALRQSQKMVTNAIFGGMEVYGLLRFRRQGGPDSLRGFFDQEENRWLSVTKLLDVELRAEDERRGF